MTGEGVPALFQETLTFLVVAFAKDKYMALTKAHSIDGLTSMCVRGNNPCPYNHHCRITNTSNNSLSLCCGEEDETLPFYVESLMML
jgi:hypothetical protein